MKKILAFVLAVACTLSLAGCGGNNARPEDVSDALVEEQLPEPGGAASFDDEGSGAEGQPTETPQGGVVSLDEIQEKFNSLVYESISGDYNRPDSFKGYVDVWKGTNLVCSFYDVNMYDYPLYDETGSENVYDFSGLSVNDLISAWGEPDTRELDGSITKLVWYLDEPLDRFADDFPDLCVVPVVESKYHTCMTVEAMNEDICNVSVASCLYHKHSPGENYGALWDGTVVCEGMLANRTTYFTGIDNVVKKMEITAFLTAFNGNGYAFNNDNEVTMLWGEDYTVSDVVNANPNLGENAFALYAKKENVPDEIDPSKPLTAYVSGLYGDFRGDYDNPVYVNGVCVRSIDDVPALIDVIGTPSEVSAWNMVSSEYFDASEGYAAKYTWYMDDGWNVSISFDDDIVADIVTVEFSFSKWRVSE